MNPVRLHPVSGPTRPSAVRPLERRHALVTPPPPPDPQAPRGDVEVSLRVCADGTRISVVRRTVADGDGRRTVGIDAVIR